MKRTIILAGLAIAAATTVFAGRVIPPVETVPDAGASILLLGIGMSAVGLVRWAKKR
jgi:hypothetical protein